MVIRKIDFGEYLIKVTYNEFTHDLDIDVYGELGKLIESLNIKDDEEEDIDEPETGFTLN